ncbi:phage tail tape measure protein [Anaerophilus nitritogenes]|uniref:phage tail tape measure protein n=1 Tax=Anaerophilus nitritogenes TaxID=2498136 RepID=UPI00101CFD46|nr:phage tail tape measure protein [Anaerophilus nitritogenes]
MSSDNRVRVLFEAVMDNFRTNVDRGIREVLEIGNAGERAGERSRQGFNRASQGLENMNGLANKFKDTLKTIVKIYIGKKFIDLGKTFVTEFGKTKTALGEMASLGYDNAESLEYLRQKAIEFSSTWSGTTREEFIQSAYDIKSGIATLTDEGVADFTELAALTGKATKATANEMTTLFAQGYGIYRDLYNSDFDFGEKFSAGIAKSVQRFRTQGSEMSGYLTTLGANAKNAGKELDEILSVGGLLQQTNSGSEAATMYQSFLNNAMQASKKLKISFVDQNNQLLSTAEIIEKIKGKYGNVLDAVEKNELSKAFGRIEATKFIDLLYNKTEELKDAQNEVNKSINDGVEATKKMAETMNSGPLEKINIFKQRVANAMEKIGEKMAPAIDQAMDKLFEAMDKAENDGTFDNLAQNIADLYNNLINKGIELLNHIDDISATISNFTGFISDHLDTILFAAEAWMIFKFAMTAGKIIEAVSVGVHLLTLAITGQTIATEGATIAQRLLNIAIASNPIGAIITVIGILILALYKLNKHTGIVKKAFIVFINVVKGAFLIFVYVYAWGMNYVIQLMYNFISLIPGMGEKFKRVSEMSKKSLEEIRKELKKTKDAIVDVNNTPIDIKNNKKSKEETELEKEQKKLKAEMDKLKNLDDKQIKKLMDSESGASSNGNSNTIEKVIRKITDKYSDKVDLYESRAELANSKDDDAGVKFNKEKMIEALKQTASELLRLENRSSGKDKNIVESARNRVLTKIAKITEDIKGGINKMVGEFNKPSELKALTKYDYAINNAKNTLSKTAIVAPNLTMYLTLEDTGEKGREKIQREVMPLLDIFNNTSETALKTITRNG